MADSQLLLLLFISLGSCGRISMQENLDLKRSCGPYKRRAVYKSFGGTEIKPNEYPWIVKYFYWKGGKEHVCSGALISTRHLLTSAHCLTDYNTTEVNEQCRLRKGSRRLEPHLRNKTRMSIVIGSKCLHPERCHERRSVERFWIHEHWDPCTQAHDIATVELTKDVVVSEEVAPICLPSEDLKLAILLRAAGAGLNRTLIPTKEDSVLRVVNYFSYRKEDPELGLIMMRERNVSLCTGDSGGPLFQFNQQNRFTIVGTSIGGENDCTENHEHYDNYFVDVRLHLDWICHKTGACPISDLS
ncbi:Trypsin [Trichostrongylus colubriformis]|uniref:Trypsin n=1 Tax=Trichostrongylus colubriformis TaxID=6319 RepID=A0AAN8FPL8_TRICO